MKQIKIVNETIENLNELFQYCFLLVGLRERSLPNELESLFIHEYLRENYGGHTIAEIKLAFKMAVKGELDLQPDEVKCYENFSVIYLSQIINSYRRWASQEYFQIEKFITPDENEIKKLEGSSQEIHWGYLIEKAYQHFLSFGDEGWRTFPIGFYNQLVLDNLIDTELYRKAMPIVRKKLVGVLQRDKAVLQLKRFDNDEKDERRLFHKSAIELKIQENDKIINEYSSGEKDGEIEVAAKQYCVLQFFKNSKQSFKNNVYMAAE